ncbi:MAG: hypothetical protein SGPRY_011592, partial [Prymnesium sp.]
LRPGAEARACKVAHQGLSSPGVGSGGDERAGCEEQTGVGAQRLAREQPSLARGRGAEPQPSERHALYGHGGKYLRIF